MRCALVSKNNRVPRSHTLHAAVLCYKVEEMALSRIRPAHSSHSPARGGFIFAFALSKPGGIYGRSVLLLPLFQLAASDFQEILKVRHGKSAHSHTDQSSRKPSSGNGNLPAWWPHTHPRGVRKH
jgi:hypothetical protein